MRKAVFLVISISFNRTKIAILVNKETVLLSQQKKTNINKNNSLGLTLLLN